MAFRQPTSFAPLRRAPFHDVETNGPVSPQKTTVSQEWVSKLSDFGSLNTVAKSGQYEDEALDFDDDDDEDEELDSLDDGLQAFRDHSMYNTSRRADQSGGSILPAHDGLGTFAASSTPVQEQLWNFGLYDLRRSSVDRRRRRSSAQRRLDQMGNEEGACLDSIRMERIEQWRIEQSKVLLAEIEKETRNRDLRRNAEERQDQSSSPKSTASTCKRSDECQTKSITTPPEQVRTEDSGSLIQRIARKVIRDLIGIDDSLLAIIFGESLVTDEILSTTPTPRESYLSPVLLPYHRSERIPFSRSWKERLLHRLARELGFLVHQLSDHSETANTSSQPKPMDYGGIPITEEAFRQASHTTAHSRSGDSPQSPPIPQFTPTLGQRQPLVASASEHAAGWGVEEVQSRATSPRADVEYWERTPDLKTVFGYLQRRFASQRRSASITATSNIALASTPDSLCRAAIIRQHHPLVSRSTRAHDRHVRHNNFLVHHSTSHLSPSLKRAGTSCASLSTKKSKRDVSEGSRNYWDLGGSIGSGSGIASLGGMGVWGEV